MGHQHSADGGVGAQGSLYLHRVGGGSTTKLQHLHINAKPAHSVGPAVAKDAGGEHQSLVPA